MEFTLATPLEFIGNFNTGKLFNCGPNIPRELLTRHHHLLLSTTLLSSNFRWNDDPTTMVLPFTAQLSPQRISDIKGQCHTCRCINCMATQPLTMHIQRQSTGKACFHCSSNWLLWQRRCGIPILQSVHQASSQCYCIHTAQYHPQQWFHTSLNAVPTRESSVPFACANADWDQLNHTSIYRLWVLLVPQRTFHKGPPGPPTLLSDSKSSGYMPTIPANAYNPAYIDIKILIWNQQSSMWADSHTELIHKMMLQKSMHHPTKLVTNNHNILWSFGVLLLDIVSLTYCTFQAFISCTGGQSVSYVLLWQPSECVYLIMLCCSRKINMMMMMTQPQHQILVKIRTTATT